MKVKTRTTQEQVNTQEAKADNAEPKNKVLSMKTGIRAGQFGGMGGRNEGGVIWGS